MVKKPTYQELERSVEELEHVAQELAESEEMFRWIAENTSEAFYIKDTSTGSYEYISPVFDRIFGVSREKLYEDASYVFSVLLHPDNRERVNAARQRQDEQGEWFNEQYRILRPDGTLRWIWARSFPVYDAQGQVSHIIGIAEDITERKQAEEELESIFNLSPDMVGVFTTEGRLIRVNPSWETILGYKTEELLEMGWATLVHPDDVEGTNKEVEEQLKGSPVVNFINRYKCKDGSYKTLEWRATFAKEGIVYATARDITERKQVEETLQESEEKYRAIFNEARDGIVLVDSQTGNIADCNPEFERQTGRKLEQLREMKVWEIRPPEKIDVAKEKFHDIKEKGAGGSVELEFQRPDGEIVPIEFVSTSITIGGKHYLQSMVKDITERKQADEERNRFFDLSLHLLLIAGFDGYIKRINPGWTEVLGYTVEELIGTSFFELVHPDDRAATLAEMDKLSTGKATLYFENRYRCKDDSYRLLAWAAVSHPETGLIYAIAEDIDLPPIVVPLVKS